MDKSGKLRIVGYLLLIIGFMIMIFEPRITGTYNFNAASLSIFIFGAILTIVGGLINSIGYRMEKKNLREKA